MDQCASAVASPTAVFSSPAQHFRIAVYGSYGTLRAGEPLPPTGGDDTDTACRLLPPLDLADTRRWRVALWEKGEVIANAIVMSKRHNHGSILLSTRDCPTLVLVDEEAGVGALVHCSRDALHGVDARHSKSNVIAPTIDTMLAAGAYLTRMRGWILSGIGKKHFRNERYPVIVERLRQYWGDAVADVDSSLIDLPTLIRAQCGFIGSHLEHDGVDTYDDVRFGSLRAENDGHLGKNRQNLVVLTYCPPI